MGLKKMLQEASLTRRSMLKSLGVAVTAASVSGCSTDDSDEFNPLSQGQTSLEFQEADRFAFNTGPFNCGSKCVHKFHVKNERIIAMTSAGDTSMDDRASDEYGSTKLGEPMQFRSCVRGYSYIQRVYQPDRLKYPLKQTGEKGDISTFKRISWEEAYNTIAQQMKSCFDDAQTLGYIPVLDRMGFVADAAKAQGRTYLAGRSNASNGNSEAAKLDCVGTTMVRNSKADNMNSKFTVLWGCDPTRHSNHENGSYWMYTQAKEKDIDIITISPVCTDQAAMYSKSVTVELPPFAPSSNGGGEGSYSRLGTYTSGN